MPSGKAEKTGYGELDRNHNIFEPFSQDEFKLKDFMLGGLFLVYLIAKWLGSSASITFFFSKGFADMFCSSGMFYVYNIGYLVSF